MDKRYTRSWWAVVLFLVVFLSTSTIRRCGKNTYRYDEGLIFGTFYHITYKYPESLSEEIKNRLLQFDASLSPFNDTSIISRVNRNEPVETTDGSNMFQRFAAYIHTHGWDVRPYRISACQRMGFRF